MSAARTQSSIAQKKSSTPKKTRRAHAKDKAGASTTRRSSNTVAKRTKKELARPRTTALSVPSPYRLPLPRTQSLALLARVAGLCFVFTGALLALLSLNADPRSMRISQTHHGEMSALVQIGQTLTPSGSTTTGSTAIPIPDPRSKDLGTPSSASVREKDISNDDTNTIDTTSSELEANTLEKAVSTAAVEDTAVTDVEASVSTKVKVSLEAPRETLQGRIPLTVHTSVSAKNVRVSAYHTTTGVLYQAGIADRVTDTEWRLSWDTANVVNGTYRLVAVALVEDGEYESPETKVTVENRTKETQSTNATTSLEHTVVEEVADTAGSKITLSLPQQDAASGHIEIRITAEKASAVELYRQPVQSLSPAFLGQARRLDGSRWVYAWNTHETPNGEYYLFARVKNEYGVVESSKTRVGVKNMVLDTFTVEQAQEIDTLTKAREELVRPVETIPPSAQTPAVPKTVYVEPVNVFLSSVYTDEDLKSELSDILSDYRKELDRAINALGQALRKEDSDAIREARERIESLKQEILAELPDSPDRTMILDRVSAYLDQTAEELDTLTVRNDTLLKERIGEAVTQDSDKDGVSDYDEIHLYQTNPFTADTDGDGFIDSVEIRQGYDPHDSQSEAVITYESPQEVGVVREDLLQIESVSSLTFERPEEGQEVQALFSGRGLPNSFVTLYIYSTPIIVTVKTDADGNWNYVLDKELEDGDHEVYVGITDNAGRLIAKSNPLPFVKTAEAYTAGSALASADEGNGAPTLLNTNTLIFGASCLVLVLGLVLLLIGAFTQPRIREDHLTTPMP